MDDVFTGYDAVIWDYDGVIINSDETRELGFVRCLTDYPAEQVQLLLDFHRANGGLSRFVKFRYFFEEIRKEILTERALLNLCRDFSVIMRQTLPRRELLFESALKQLVRNTEIDRVQFIASGSAQDELRFLCREQGIEQHFAGIFGSPTPKNEIVASILRDNPNLESWCLIGDSINDFEAAKGNNIDFFGVRDQRLSHLSLKYLPIWN